MVLTPSQKHLGRLAGIIGTIQGITWAGLSLACILVYYTNSSSETIRDFSSYTKVLNTMIRAAYLDRKLTDDTWRVIRAKDFVIVMWFYFFLSVLWIAISVGQLTSIYYNKFMQSKFMILWGTLTCCISLVDLVFTSLLLRDYINCSVVSSSVATSIGCHTLIGVIMTLAARGFMLWLVNVIVAIVQILTGIKIIMQTKINNSRGDLTIPRVKLPQGQTNSSQYQPHYSNSSGEQSPSSVPHNPSFARNNKNKTQLNKGRPVAPSPDAEIYKKNIRRGTAIIFNHKHFINGCSSRDGTDKDRDDLKDVLEELKFDVRVHNDLIQDEILTVLQDVSKLDHTDAECFVLVVMTHGENGKLYAKDSVYQTKYLWTFLSPLRCPSLAGKPKLFFIQACRGNQSDPGVEVSYIETDSSKELSDNVYTIPIMADILVMYATVEEYFAWRDPMTGSYFIQALVNQLRKHYETKDLLSILTCVNRDVAIGFTSNEPTQLKYNKKKEMCSIVSMLTRLYYFNL